jgi:hypothetical protein
MRKHTEPAADPAGFAIFRGHGFRAVAFPALPGLTFPPGVPMPVTTEQAAIISRRQLRALAFCDATGQDLPADEPPAEDSTDSPAAEPVIEERE